MLWLAGCSFTLPRGQLGFVGSPTIRWPTVPPHPDGSGWGSNHQDIRTEERGHQVGGGCFGGGVCPKDTERLSGTAGSPSLWDAAWRLEAEVVLVVGRWP